MCARREHLLQQNLVRQARAEFVMSQRDDSGATARVLILSL